MLYFELSVVEDDISVKDAIAETIESGKSGLLVRTTNKGLRVVDFDNLVRAHESGLKLVREVDSERVAIVAAHIPDAERGFAVRSLPDSLIDSEVRSAGLVFGFLGQQGGLARMFSISEGKGGPLASASSGGRCKRPGKPQNILPRHWFHYYPPTNRDSVTPNICKFDGTLIS